jgi:D-glycero-alpha-D-manno-heptose 1-phosphate guanylyltransferase
MLPDNRMSNLFNNISVIILCGGKGTRLQTVVNDRPKSMAIINNEPFLCYLFKQLSKSDLNNIILSTGYKADIIESYFGKKIYNLSLKYSREKQSLGTGGAVKLALSKVETDYIMVMNGDSYLDIDLKSYVSWHFKNKYNSSMVLAKVENISRYGNVKADNDGRVLSFEEKDGNNKPGWINGGIYILKKTMLDTVPPDINYSLERDFFPKLIDKGLYRFNFDGKFIDIGTPESFTAAQEFFKTI